MLDADIGPAFGKTLYQVVSRRFMGIHAIDDRRVQTEFP